MLTKRTQLFVDGNVSKLEYFVSESDPGQTEMTHGG